MSQAQRGVFAGIVLMFWAGLFFRPGDALLIGLCGAAGYYFSHLK